MAVQAKLNSDLLLQLHFRESLALPQVRPAALRACLPWLQDRQALLESEMLALQSLPLSCQQPLHQKVSSLSQTHSSMMPCIAGLSALSLYMVHVSKV